MAHQYTYPQLSPEAKPNIQPAIKVSVLFKKLDSISYEEFLKHWQTVHADITVATQAFQQNILRYVHYHQPPALKEKIRKLGGNVLDFDGCAHLWVRTWEDWERFASSPEYAAALTDDSYKFIQMPPTLMMGEENLIVGNAMTEIGGCDGLSVTTE